MADNRKIESKADEGERSGRGSTDDLHGRVAKKDVAKAYEKYAERFTPKPRYFFNSLKAFATGGMICTASLWLERKFMAAGVTEQDARDFSILNGTRTGSLRGTWWKQMCRR